MFPLPRHTPGPVGVRLKERGGCLAKALEPNKRLMVAGVYKGARVSHHVAAMANRQIQLGSKFPTSAAVKEDDPEQTFHITELKGRNVIVGVPGAFTGTSSGHVPGYITAYEQFKEKGIDNVYVVSVNDVFVLKAWKNQLAPDGTKIRFIADDKAELTLALGMLFDATPLLGGPRSKRYVVVTEGDKIASVAVETNPGEVTITAVDKILPLL